jgi:hypothetical protein
MRIETPATLGARVALWIIGVLLVLGLIWGAKAFYDDYQATKAKVAAQEGVMQGTEEVSDAATTASDTANSVTQHTREVTTIYRTKYEDLKREDPEVAQWADGVVPMRVRRLQCERRAARDGLTDLQGGCSRFDTEAGSGR